MPTMDIHSSHKAHKAQASGAKVLVIHGKVWVLPVYQHIYDSKRNLAPYSDRLEMCKIAFVENTEANVGNRARVVEIEKEVSNARSRRAALLPLSFSPTRRWYTLR